VGTWRFIFRLQIPMLGFSGAPPIGESGVRAGWVASADPRPQGRRSVGP